MELRLLTWNGINISILAGSTVFDAWIEPGQLSNLRANEIRVPRATGDPWLSGTVLTTGTYNIGIRVIPGNDIATKREIIKQYFDFEDKQRHNLIAEDINDSNRQYYLTGFPVSLLPDTLGGKLAKDSFIIQLAVETRAWKVVTALSDSWSITATGQTHSVTNIGNRRVAPSFSLTPTTTRAGGLNVRRFVPIYNNLDVTFNEPLDITNGGLNTAALIADTSNSCQLNGAINNSVTTIAYDTVTGSLPSSGMGYLGTEQISWTGKTGTTSGNLTGVTRGIGGTTAASHADNVVVYVSHLQADGRDIRLWIDGAEADFFVTGINTSTTQIWILPHLSPRHEGTLKTALANASTDVTVAFTQNRANLATLQYLKKAQNTLFMIGSEVFRYTAANVDTVAYQITGCKRVQKGTSSASHAIGDTIRYIEHDAWILYGDTALSAADVDTDNQPIFDLDSTNATKAYTYFYDSTAARPGAWTGEVSASKTQLSYVYTGADNSFVDPSTELGMSVTGTQSDNQPLAETATVAWSLSHPCGFTAVPSFSGSVYRVDDFPEVAGLQYLVENTAWFTQEQVDAPTSALAWENFGPVAVTFSAPYPTSIRFVLDGTLSSTSGEHALMQVDSVSVTVDSTKLPTVSIGAEQACTFFDFTLTNNTTGEYIKVKCPITVSTALTVDCENKQAYTAANERVYVKTSTTREAWLDLTSGANTLQYDETGVAAVTLVTSHRDRSV